jgi:NitT/TauT family transport system substrate-binding protein
MQLFQKSSLLFVAHRESGVRSIEDLQGKPVQVWMNETGIMPRLFLKRQGVEPELIPLGSSLSPFLRKAVTAVSVTAYNEYHLLIEGGVRSDDLVSIVPGDFSFNYPEDGLYCMKETFRKQPELCRKVVRASIRGWAYALGPKNEQETVEVVMRQAAEARHITNDNHQTQMLRKIREFVAHRVGNDPIRWGELSKNDYEKTVELLEQSKTVTQSVPFEEFYPVQ